MKKVVIIPIAQKKRGRRGISEDWIHETVYSPDQIVKGYEGRMVAQKKYVIDGKTYLLRIIYEEKEDRYEVVTAYVTSQINRYWKEEHNED